MEEFVRDQGFLEEDIDTNLDTLRARGYSSESLGILEKYVSNAYDAEICSAILVGSGGGYNLSHLADSSFVRYMESGEKHDERATDSDMVVLLEETEEGNRPDITSIHELFYQEEGEEWTEEEIDEFIELALPKPGSKQEIPSSLRSMVYQHYDGESSEWTEQEKESIRESMLQNRGEMNDDLVDGPINMLYPELEINPRFQYKGTFQKKLQGALRELENPPESRESVIFPATDGKGIDKNPAEFLGTFMKGFTPLIEDEDVEEWIRDVRETAPEKDRDLEASIWDKLRSRIEFKERSMNMNYRLGQLERTLAESEYLDTYLSEELLEDGEEVMDRQETEISQQLNEFVKTVLAGENSDTGLSIEPFTGDIESLEEAGRVLETKEGVYEDSQQSTLDVDVEQETDPARAQAYRRAREIIEQHPDLDLELEREASGDGTAEPGTLKVKAGKVGLERSLEEFVDQAGIRIIGKKHEELR